MQSIVQLNLDIKGQGLQQMFDHQLHAKRQFRYSSKKGKIERNSMLADRANANEDKARGVYSSENYLRNDDIEVAKVKRIYNIKPHTRVNSGHNNYFNQMRKSKLVSNEDATHSRTYT